jgi:hypothetical protein
LKSSFLPLPPRLADPRVRRWAPALLAALALQLPILLALQAGWPEARRPRSPARLDDTPILLNWSRPAPSAKPAASLNTIPLQGLLALPPPPASLVPQPTSSQAVPATQPTSQPSSPPSPLPRRPGEAFLLARQVAAGGQPGEASAGLVAVQRRQWWLLPGQEPALLSIWAGAKEQPLPASLGSQPQGIEIRSVALAAAEPLAFGDLHGRSIRHGNELWLLWRQGAILWILRGALTDP